MSPNQQKSSPRANPPATIVDKVDSTYTMTFQDLQRYQDFTDPSNGNRAKPSFPIKDKAGKLIKEKTLPWSDGYKEVHPRRCQLPAYPELPRFIEAFTNNRVIIVSSPTGSGKSTQIPQVVFWFLLHDKRKGACWMTQPRKLPTKEVYQRLAVELDVKPGEEVGIQMRGMSNIDAKKTRLVVMTDGLLLAKFREDPDISDVDAVIIDEAHERGLNMDVAFGLLKLAMARRPELRVIVMSATADNDTFIEHFKPYSTQLVELSGRPKENSHHFLTSDSQIERDWVRIAHRAIHGILMDVKLEEGDILVFAPGVEDIKKLQDLLRLDRSHPDPHLRHLLELVDILPLYRDASKAEQVDVLVDRCDDHGNQRRKIIIATNIAETSITFPHLKYVVDCGMTKTKVYNAVDDRSELLLVDCSKSQIMQRIGRVGRTSKGYAISLYTKAHFDNLQEHARPPILRSDLTETVLQMVLIGLPVDGMKTWPWPTQPHPNQVIRAVSNLLTSGMITGGLKPTPLATTGSKLGTSYKIANLIVGALDSPDLAEDLLILAALLDVNQLRRNPSNKDERNEAHAAWLLHLHPNGELLTDVNLWRHWYSKHLVNGGDHFALTAWLQHSACLQVLDRYTSFARSFTEELGGGEIKPTEERNIPDYDDRMTLHILNALIDNLVVKTGIVIRKRNVYQKMSEMSEKPHIHRPEGRGRTFAQNLFVPKTTLDLHEFDPVYFVYSELKHSSGNEETNMLGVTRIPVKVLRMWDPEWKSPSP